MNLLIWGLASAIATNTASKNTPMKSTMNVNRPRSTNYTCSVDIERTKKLFRNNLFMMMPRSSFEGFGDLNPYDDAV